MGCAGVDRVTIAEFQDNLAENLETLQSLLRENQYSPLPLLKIDVKKEDNNRKIAIPAIRDRIVQSALLNVIEPYFEPSFLDCSFAYRPNRGAHQALNRVEKLIKKGFTWTAKADIENFFDNVDHEILIKSLAEKVNDSNIINLISKTLYSQEFENNKGIAQGSVISPLFSNIYLHKFDETMVYAGYNIVRYADDFVVLTDSSEIAQQALQKAEESLDQLRLQLNKEKTCITNIKDGFVFLGYEFNENGKFPSKTALSLFTEKIYKEINHPFERKKISEIINGWKGYFKLEELSLKELLEKVQDILRKEPDSVPLRILLSATLMEFNQNDKAKEIIQGVKDFESKDSKIHYDIAMLCIELGLESQAFEELIAAYKIDSNNFEYAYNIALLYIKKKHFDRAISFLQKVIDINPAFSEAYQVLGFLYQKMKLKGFSDVCFKRAHELSPDVYNHIEPLEMSLNSDHNDFSDFSSFDKETVSRYLSIFSGREGVYAKEILDKSGKVFYLPIKKNLDEEQILNHIRGDETLAIYCSRIDNTVMFLVIDVDISRSAWLQSSDNEEKRKSLIEKCNLVTEKLLLSCKKVNIPAYMESTGGKGKHLWIFFAEPVESKKARELARNVIRGIGGHPSDISLEIFPKQDFVSKEALGSLIRLPMGINKKTSSRSVFIDEKGAPYINQTELLNKIRKFSRKSLNEGLKSVPEIYLSATKEVSNEVQKVIERCNVIKFLVSKAKESGDLRHTERLVLLYTLGHLGESGKSFLHRVMSNCLNYNYNYTQRWINRLRKNQYPISCPKIRDWLSYITPSVGCFCKFDFQNFPYPTPLIHSGLPGSNFINEDGNIQMHEKKEEKELLEDKKEIIIESKETPDSFSPAKIKEIEGILQSLFENRQIKEEAENKIRNFENRIIDLFAQNQIESIETKFGKLRLVKNKDDYKFEIDI